MAAASINIAAYSDALVVLGTAGLVVPAARRFGLNPVLGYLGAGALLGPLGLGSYVASFPFLYWVTVVDAKNVAGIAELGVVFLLFLIGLELSFNRLVAMRRMVFGFGGLQIGITAAILTGIATLAGLSLPVALIIGACLALSSTAIVLEILSGQGRLTSHAGRTSFSVLLAQDLAVIPILIFVSLLGADNSGGVLESLTAALVQAGIAMAFIVVGGRLFLKPLFRLVATTQSTELFIATTLFVIVGMGFIAAMAGLSMALGAFVAGLLLAETEYNRAVEATIKPFKGLLLGIFFFTIGMNIDFREVLRDPILLALSVVGLILLKAVVVMAIAAAFRIPRPVAVESALLLGPGGEFAFVGIGLATTLAIIPGEVSSFIFAVTSLTMAAIPALAVAGRRLAAALTPVAAPEPELAELPAPHAGHAVVVGYGRVGKVVCALLKRHGVPFIAVDLDAGSVTRDRRRGDDVFFGDASNPEFLHACGLKQAAGLILTIHDQAAIDGIIDAARAIRPDVLIVSRARDATHARHLYGLGVNDVVPETIEASLQLSESALVALGVPTGAVIASIHDERDVVRRELQQAADQAGRPSPQRLRAPT